MGQNRSFLLGELIGEKVVITKTASLQLSGLKGTIIDETMNTFVIEAKNGRKRIPKKGNVFFFPSSGLAVKGSQLLIRPEERTKKLGRKTW